MIKRNFNYTFTYKAVNWIDYTFSSANRHGVPLMCVQDSLFSKSFLVQQNQLTSSNSIVRSVKCFARHWLASTYWQTCAKMPRRSWVLDPQYPGSGPYRVQDPIFSFSRWILGILDHRDRGFQTGKNCRWILWILEPAWTCCRRAIMRILGLAQQ